MRTERYELRDDPCAAGKWRGGIGMIRTNRFLVDTIVSCEGERTESDPPWGIFGGHEGTNASTKIIRPRARSRCGRRSSPATRCRPARRSRSRCRTPAASATRSTRDPELVLSDVLDGFTTAELAERDYGVVIDAERKQVDADATRRLRELARADAGARAT